MIIPANGGEVAAARGVKQVGLVTATIGKTTVIGLALCVLPARAIGAKSMLPTGIGRGPAACVGDGKIPVIALAIPTTQDRNLAIDNRPFLGA